MQDSKQSPKMPVSVFRRINLKMQLSKTALLCKLSQQLKQSMWSQDTLNKAEISELKIRKKSKTNQAH